jgi:hypothetical protein
MIKIRIAEEERQLDSVDEQWINQQINRRRAEGHAVCVRVTIHEGGLDMILSTPDCVTSAGGGRPPRPQEKKVFDLWNQRGLNGGDFTGGNLVAFLRQLKQLS